MTDTEQWEHFESLVERRNRYVNQAKGLRQRLEALRRKIERIDTELAESQAPVTYTPQGYT
jgi:hypothetical protein